eukprot:1526595-Pyramimonas_sp.AAC.1
MHRRLGRPLAPVALLAVQEAPLLGGALLRPLPPRDHRDVQTDHVEVPLLLEPALFSSDLPCICSSFQSVSVGVS